MATVKKVEAGMQRGLAWGILGILLVLFASVVFSMINIAMESGITATSVLDLFVNFIVLGAFCLAIGWFVASKFYRKAIKR